MSPTGVKKESKKICFDPEVIGLLHEFHFQAEMQRMKVRDELRCCTYSRKQNSSRGFIL